MKKLYFLSVIGICLISCTAINNLSPAFYQTKDYNNKAIVEMLKNRLKEKVNIEIQRNQNKSTIKTEIYINTSILTQKYKNKFKIESNNEHENTSLRKKTYLLGKDAINDIHKKNHDSNIFDPSDINAALNIDPNEGNMNHPSGMNLSSISVNDKEKLDFQNGIFGIKFKDPTFENTLRSLYGMEIKIDNPLFKTVTFDLTKAPVNKIETLIDEYNKHIVTKIDKIEFSSINSLRAFSILLDILINYNDKIYTISVNRPIEKANSLPVVSFDDSKVDSSTKSWWLEDNNVTKAWNYSIGTGTMSALLEVNPSFKTNTSATVDSAYYETNESMNLPELESRRVKYNSIGNVFHNNITSLDECGYYAKFSSDINAPMVSIKNQNQINVVRNGTGSYSLEEPKLTNPNDSKAKATYDKLKLIYDDSMYYYSVCGGIGGRYHGYFSTVVGFGERNNYYTNNLAQKTPLKTVGVAPNGNVMPMVTNGVVGGMFDANYAMYAAAYKNADAIGINFAIGKGLGFTSSNIGAFDPTINFVSCVFSLISPKEKDGANIPIVISASNEGEKIEDHFPDYFFNYKDDFPVILVGGIVKTNGHYEVYEGNNYGSDIIWFPTSNIGKGGDPVLLANPCNPSLGFKNTSADPSNVHSPNEACNGNTDSELIKFGATSCAEPQALAAVSLIKSRNPYLNVKQIKDILMRNLRNDLDVQNNAKIPDVDYNLIKNQIKLVDVNAAVEDAIKIGLNSGIYSNATKLEDFLPKKMIGKIICASTNCDNKKMIVQEERKIINGKEVISTGSNRYVNLLKTVNEADWNSLKQNDKIYQVEGWENIKKGSDNSEGFEILKVNTNPSFMVQGVEAIAVDGEIIAVAKEGSRTIVVGEQKIAVPINDKLAANLGNLTMGSVELSLLKIVQNYAIYGIPKYNPETMNTIRNKIIELVLKDTSGNVILTIPDALKLAGVYEK